MLTTAAARFKVKSNGQDKFVKNSSFAFPSLANQ